MFSRILLVTLIAGLLVITPNAVRAEATSDVNSALPLTEPVMLSDEEMIKITGDGYWGWSSDSWGWSCSCSIGLQAGAGVGLGISYPAWFAGVGVTVAGCGCGYGYTYIGYGFFE
jgi:hypothetical protein